ncbi:MAG: tetratricopeptide repeat protein [Bacteroidales bacterium]|nr:tetratricopeptide repeat protein [Bacteroidales bacterium]
MIKRLLISFLIALLAGYSLTAADTRKPSFLDGVQAYSLGRYQVAVSVFNKIVTEEPSNDAAWYYLGMSWVEKDVDTAKKCLKKAAELDPDNYWYKETLARVYMYNKEFEMAETLYVKLRENYPKKTDILYSLINLYLSQGDFDKALSSIEALETESGKSDATVMTRFNIFRQKKDNENAYKVLREYVNEYSSPYILTMLGDYEMSMYNDTTALSYYDEALSLDRDYVPARLGKAEVYRLTRKYPEYFSCLDGVVSDPAIPAAPKSDYLKALFGHVDRRFIQTFTSELDSMFVKGMVCHPADTGMVQAAGIFYIQSDRMEEAAGMFRKGMEMDTTSLASASTYVQILAQMKDWESVVSNCEVLRARFPQEPGFREMTCVAYYNLKEYGKVVELCDMVLSDKNLDTETRVSMLSTKGDMLMMLKDRRGAYKAYDEALKYNPTALPVLNNYAWYMCEEGKNLKKALKMSAITIEKEPDNPTYLDTYGWILHLLGRDSEARTVFKHAMLYGAKESKTALGHYARILEKLGEKDAAKVYKDMADKLGEDAE